MTNTPNQGEPGNDLTEIFGPVIHAYTRAQGIADGVLHDVTDMAREVGFKIPVALTAGAWNDCVAWTDADDKRKGGFTGQSNNGRLWDVLNMTRFAAARQPDRDRVNVVLVRIPRSGRGTMARRVHLVAVVGPGDNAEPVITIMLPDED
jgi:hypothetical protein